MIQAEVFCGELRDRGFTVASGVPCSSFAGPIALLEQQPQRYVAAANEGGALATAAGIALTGQRSYVMLQNSGMGNLINPVTSLLLTYHIPVLMFISLRGWPDPAEDEPQHEVMGQVTAPLLDLLGLPYWKLLKTTEEVHFREILTGAEESMDNGRPPVVLVEKGAIGQSDEYLPSRPHALDSKEVIRAITELAGDSPVIATTGYTGRELFGVADRPGNFYMQGSMGHASSIALGVAMASPDKTVIVLDGDGAALMHMGALSAIGAQAPANLVHIVLDNGTHESTGGQATTSTRTSLEDVAIAAGYQSARRCQTLQAIREEFAWAQTHPGPHLRLLPTRPRTKDIPSRATASHSPTTIRDRFKASLSAAP